MCRADQSLVTSPEEEEGGEKKGEERSETGS